MKSAKQICILSTIISIITITSLMSWSVTEPEYLTKNKAYTDGLIQFLKSEEIHARQLEILKKSKKDAEAQLKTETANLANTAKKLTSEQNNLASLKNKELNKNQLESSLKSQKQQNLSKISNLNNQISGVESSLQNVNTTVSQLKNEENLLASKYNTQNQVVNFAKNTVNNLEDDIRRLEWEIDRAEDEIRRLNQQIDQLQLKKATETDPAALAQIQAQIQQKKNKKQSLQSDISFAESRLNSKKLHLISAESDLSQEKNKLNTLKIQLNGKQNELQSQLNLKNSLQNEINGYQSQKTTLVTKNKGIDADLDVLANLPFSISESEAKIQNFTQVKAQQEALVAQSQSNLATVSAALSSLQQLVDHNKATVLAQEKEHDTVLKAFLETNPVVVPTVLPEGTISIDSLLPIETVDTSKDWSVFKGTSTTLDGAQVCVASTQVLDSVSGIISELMVVKMGDTVTGYSSPFVLTTHSQILDLVVKGQLKTDSSKSILLPLFQSPVANEKALITRYSDATHLISYLKAHSTARVEFTVPGSPISIPFSLRGSSAMVNKMLETCKNP